LGEAGQAEPLVFDILTVSCIFLMPLLASCYISLKLNSRHHLESL